MCKDGKGGRCRTNGVRYEVRFTRCNCVYIGETSRNLYTRGKEHLNKKMEETHFMKEHMDKCHEGMDSRFTGRVTHCNKDCLSRQVREGVMIRRCTRELMNTKSEWFQPSVFRVMSEVVRE